MRRVIVLGPTPPPYHGVATFTRDLLESRDFREFELLHLDTSDRRDASNLGRWDAQNVCLGISNLSELAGRCLRSNADLVYLPLSQSVAGFLRDALFILQAYAMGKRVVIHLHGGYFRTLYDTQGAAFQATARAALRCVSAAIVLGEDFRGIFSGLIPDERVHVVENGVPDVCSTAGVHLRDANTPATVLYMSTLTRTKGILELIEALALLRTRRPAMLRVAGEWQEPGLRTEALALIERAGLRDAVEFLGNVTGAAKSEFLASGDVFCLLTRYPYEGQPLVLLEAMAAGLPVLSTRTGVIASTVSDGVSGIVMQRNPAPQEIADALERMLANPAQLAAFGTAARERYLNQYTLHVCHMALAGVFNAATR